VAQKAKMSKNFATSEESTQNNTQQPNRTKPDITITNKDTILSDIDKAFGKTKPPAIEFLIARPHSAFNLFGLGYGINFNWYGHSCVVYTMPDGTRKVFNIAKKPGRKSIVEKFSPEDYLFTRMADQGGIYNRSFVGLRVENVPDEDIIKMDKKFQEIDEQSINGTAKFEVILGPIYNTFKRVFPVMAERGNCARWASSGLQEAGLVKKRSLFPKDTFIQMFEGLDPTNVNVVTYKCILSADKDYGAKAVNPLEPVSPLQFLRNMSYWNLDWYSQISVGGDLNEEKNTYTAKIYIKDPADVRKPSKIRHKVVNNPIVMFGCATISLYLFKRYPYAMIGRFMRRSGY
jgi:hypothetical protein